MDLNLLCVLTPSNTLLISYINTCLNLIYGLRKYIPLFVLLNQMNATVTKLPL